MAAVNYALGLNLVRSERHNEALIYLEQASQMEPENARYAYVYGVGLHSSGKPLAAVDFLEKSLKENPYDRDLLYSLSTFNHELGRREEALKYAGRLIEYYPTDPNYQQLIQYLRSSLN